MPRGTVPSGVAALVGEGAGVAIFDTLIYGGPLRSGYQPGEITFSLGALGPNLRYMPAHLIQAMPMLALGLGALAGIAVVWLRSRRAGSQPSPRRTRHPLPIITARTGGRLKPRENAGWGCQ